MRAKKLLIVDDDPEMRLALGIRLRANGYEVVSAVDGISAITEARKHRPDLLLLDLGLPGGDGFTVLERLKALDMLAEIPIVVISGRDRYVNKDRALQAGAKVFLQKPVRSAELLSTIQELLVMDQPEHRSPVVYDVHGPSKEFV